MVCDTVAPKLTLGKLALIGVAESCGCGTGGGGGVGGCGVGGGVLGGGVPLPLAEVLDPITTPAQPLPIIEAASTSATRHIDVLLTLDHWADDPSDHFCSIVRQV